MRSATKVRIVYEAETERTNLEQGIGTNNLIK